MVLAAATLNGCGWYDSLFGGKPSPIQSEPLRPGVDRQTTATGLPPAPNRGNYDAGVAPVDDSRGQSLGGIVPTKGGQKAQIEAAEKERAQRDAEREKERAEREAQRNREKKDEEERPKGAPPASAPSDQAPAPAAPVSDQVPAPVPTPAPTPAPEPSSPPAAR
jgi:hypothetical protein